MNRIHSAIAGFAAFMAVATSPRAQGISPLNDKERVRFERVTHAVEKAGYKTPMIVGHGDGATDWLFVLLATRGDSGVLVATAEPATMETAKPVVLERDRDQAQFGIRGIRFDFVGGGGLFDVEVQHEPFQLESSRKFSTHHIVRRGSFGLANACEFGGDASSSASKGIGSISSTRRVTIEKTERAPVVMLTVKTVDETIERRNRDTVATVTAHNESHSRYELPASGLCKVIQ